ncbi:MAG: ribonuclease HII [Chloroflexi bacterium HGW-Chloroflexi-10]|nr:MAG: ribonuclease HII [Chloroflexi bacterium HGW-Chloroflexi-10]
MGAPKHLPDLPTNPDLSFERDLWSPELQYIAGLDEAGRGAWAGPVAAGVVILPMNENILKQLFGVRDSKQMTPRQREYWAEQIKQHVLAWGTGFASHAEIDQYGILPATRLAMTRALEQLTIQPQHLLIDALRLPLINLPQTAIIKGDRRSLSIAAASVLAKTARDHWMRQIDTEYSDYGFAIHKGYGTKQHHSALCSFGPCAIHRFSFKPLQARLWETGALDSD